MSHTQNYESWGEVVGNKYNQVESQDWYPFHNQWRGQPLSQRAWVKQNIAGFYPYNKPQRIVKAPPEEKWQSTWYYPCSTIFPSNPQYISSRYIFMER
jgi:hypothetical protein